MVLTLCFALCVLYHAIIATERESVKLLVINNLSSGYGEGAVYDFARSFAKDGDEVCIRSTDGATDVRDLLEDATSYDAVVASGGDGTVATVSYSLAGTGVLVIKSSGAEFSEAAYTVPMMASSSIIARTV